MKRSLTALFAVAAALGPAVPAAADAGPGPASPSLNGLWHTAFDGHDQYLRIDGLRYAAFVEPARANRGRVDVSGDTITFSGSNHCDGVGSYRWSMDGSTLTFTSLGADPCPRARVLALPWDHVSG